jgi:hypothetical protein
VKPILLLDIDGVIAPFLPAAQMLAIETGEGHHDYIMVELQADSVYLPYEQRHYIRRDLPEIMRELMEHFELMWGTAWGGEQANTYMLEHLGLVEPLKAIDYHTIPDIAEVRMSGISFIGGMPDFWKMPWIEKFAEESGLPFIFIDDEISKDAEEWAEQRTRDGIPTLLVKTDAAVGWTVDHKDQMIEWAKRICKCGGLLDDQDGDLYCVNCGHSEPIPEGNDG